MSPSRKTVTVRVPASTSNCGAGFDTLGLALQLHNRVMITHAARDGAHPSTKADVRAQALAGVAAESFFAATRVKKFGFSYSISGCVPVARGLGSSATILAGVIAGLDALAGTKLSRRRMIGLVTKLEGHPDNAAAAILGGFTIARCDPTMADFVEVVKFAVPDELAFVVASPKFEIPTDEARRVLPETLPFSDAVRSMNSAVFFVAALASLDYEKLRPAVRDFFHEPYRLPHIPGGRAAIEAGVGAGALTGWLSGSGSSVLCVSLATAATAVATAMQAAFGREKISSETRVLLADNAGLQLE